MSKDLVVQLTPQLGTRQNSAVLSLSASKGRFGINGSGSTYYSWPNDGNFDFESIQQSNGFENILTQEGVVNSERLGFNGKLGAFYDLNAYNSFQFKFFI